MIASASSFMKTVVLVIAGCTGDASNITCPNSVEAEVWWSQDKEVCEQFIRQKSFEPEDYLPGYPYYEVECQ